MSDNTDSLDGLLSGTAKEEQNLTIDNNDYISLEDEFASLLNDFIQQDDKKESPKDTGLDSMLTSDTQSGLDSFASSSNSDSLDSFASSNNIGGLDSFVSSGASSGGLDSFLTKDDSSSGLDGFVTGGGSSSGGLDSLISPTQKNDNKKTAENSQTPASNEEKDTIKTEEQELARAMSNFQDAIYAMADKKNLKVPETDYEESMLVPNYKPSVGKKIAIFMLDCWDIINKYDPENMKRLPKDATDEEYLSFAESLNDTDMQLAIISYVEILINIEICEVGYEQRKEIAQKNRIKKELYEEYMELQERKAMFIKKLKEKNFPIDAEKLINNYFRAAQKDASGAFDALIKNPAMFASIDFSKIKPKFFGLIKVTPEDGIKANQKIGEFIKKLKV